jgi:hypothetical protein
MKASDEEFIYRRSGDLHPVDQRGETCGSCDDGQYPEGGDNGTVACGRDCTLKNKTDRACTHWTLFRSGPKEGLADV